MSLAESAANPMTRTDLASFVDKLADSLVEEPEIWENSTLEDFLRSWSAWLSDMEGYFVNNGMAVPGVPSWELIAQMLLAARVYE